MKFQQTEGQNENEQNLQLKRPLTESGTMSLKQSQKSAHAFSCKDSCNVLPDNPSTWPQCPLMIRPTPHSSTKVIGIRRARGDTYEALTGFHDSCILPINNGREVEGESVVIDFESTYFVGTLLLRIKQAPPVPLEIHGNSCHEEDESNTVEDDKDQKPDYFANKKRKFQAVIKGRFRAPLSMSKCVTGQSFGRPAGKLPARWLVQSFIKFISVLAPQLDASFGDKPRFLTPLVATAQTVLSEECKNQEYKNRDDISSSSKKSGHGVKFEMEADIEEPSSMESSSVLSALRTNNDLIIDIPDTTSLSAMGRGATRKKIFNALNAKESTEPRFDLNKVYTFEFYQHLLDFGDQLSIDVGKIGGMFPISQAMDGQPLKVMAAYKDSKNKQELDSLWSFDIFHESLYSYAKLALG